MTLPRRKVLAGMGAIGALAGSMTIKHSRAADETVKIGFIAPLSGSQAEGGRPCRLGALSARNYINKNGGIKGRQLELVELDTASNPNQAVSAARELASRGVNLIVGPHITSEALAVSSLLPELKSVACFMGTPDIRFTHDLFNRNLFVTAQNNYTREHEIAEFMAKKFPDIKTWAGAIPDIEAGHGGWAAFTAAIRDMYTKIAKHDLTILEPALSKFGAIDYKPQISNLLAQDATGFWTMEFGQDGITFYQQAVQLGLPKKYKAMIDYGIDIDLPKTLKRKMPDYVWTSSYWYYGATLSNPMTQEVVRLFTENGDPYPHGFAIVGHAPVMAYASAIAATGSTDIDKVIPAMEGNKFDTLSGSCYYRKEDHQLIGRSYMVNWEPTEAEPGWKAREFAAIEDADVINPPNPGKKWVD